MNKPSVPAVLVLGLLSLAAATAQETPDRAGPQPSGQIETQVFNYGGRDSTCIRWTDKCRTCLRSADAEIVCSNIGIACQPAELACLERQQAQDVKENKKEGEKEDKK